MSDDGFIREVNEELRQDQLKMLWSRYGVFAISAAALLVLATAAFVGYEYWTTNKANQAGDEFAQAMDLADDGKTDEAIAELTSMAASSYGSYPVLAELKLGAVLAEAGKTEEAIASFDTIANDSSTHIGLRNMARIRAAILLVDNGSYADVASRVEQLTGDGVAVRHSARELLALSAWKAGNRENAQKLFEQIVEDLESPQGVRERAEMMLELISGSGTN